VKLFGVGCVGLVSLLMMAMTLYAGGIVVHTFNSGDVISADVLNETITKMGDVTDGFETPADLVGIWKCTVIKVGNETAPWSAHSSGMYSTLTATVTFTDNGDGTYSYASTGHNLYHAGGSSDTGSESGQYFIVHEKMITERVGETGTTLSRIRRVSPNKFLWEYSDSTPSSQFIVCERTDVPPNIPTKLRATTSGLIVTLSWTDTSADETGFRILRRDSLTGTYLEIATVDADVTTYADTVPLTQVPTTRKYWYRVRSTNTDGQSLGSNVVKVTVTL